MSESVPNPAAVSEDVAQRIRALTEQFIDTAKQGGNFGLDAFERSLQNLVEFQQQAAGATQIDWVNTVAQAHAKFIQDVSSAYVSAARDMLK
jgi:hypothetical protein